MAKYSASFNQCHVIHLNFGVCLLMRDWFTLVTKALPEIDSQPEVSKPLNATGKDGVRIGKKKNSKREIQIFISTPRKWSHSRNPFLAQFTIHLKNEKIPSLTSQIEPKILLALIELERSTPENL